MIAYMWRQICCSRYRCRVHSHGVASLIVPFGYVASRHALIGGSPVGWDSELNYARGSELLTARRAAPSNMLV